MTGSDSSCMPGLRGQPSRRLIHDRDAEMTDVPAHHRLQRPRPGGALRITCRVLAAGRRRCARLYSRWLSLTARRQLLPRNRKWFHLMAEGPADEIRKIQAVLDVLYRSDEVGFDGVDATNGPTRGRGRGRFDRLLNIPSRSRRSTERATLSETARTATCRPTSPPAGSAQAPVGSRPAVDPGTRRSGKSVLLGSGRAGREPACGSEYSSDLADAIRLHRPAFGSMSGSKGLAGN